ncbi:methylated-DNA--[protein]-cysteine S-methyltransferase [Paenibacillus athensensis]|uniref:Methylated-DNA--protein-cysteine methyltransferase n=1 Tax=Paenibacillus athensensis TaxID=1967502 RepID=A0A4Y8PWL7_9BACL|nr:methylated-DNA--[protein]-cysteine S-methyltransferase [Paenibacillus athensensis]MCD1261490.1 methylated-DNA--[protein]-cysteine S-methyltransferase [Paenibacillus athensensis]
MLEHSGALYWTQLRHRLLGERTLYMLATEQGLARITWPEETMDALLRWRDRHAPGAGLIADAGRLAFYAEQLTAYLQGERQRFTLPLDLRGTPFQLAVWEELQRIPHGEARSYSQVAVSLGRPRAVRAVGTANGANPVPIVVPCHRVMGKNNELTGFRGGLSMKAALLRLEGVESFAVKGHARYQDC